ncbi:MAG: methyl-accepting chemotaxis protein, partial [Firmicutes bacterium]|nr:methyl-accepting chemotaxis protein [Bacillota bacterium]
MKIEKQITWITTGMVVATISLIALLGFWRMYESLKQQALATQESRIATFWELARQKGTFHVSDGKLMAGESIINGNFELPDKLKELCGGTATLFLGDTRVSTNVLKPDGQRAIGTQLKGPAREEVLGKGGKFRGENEILGETYFAAYDPIKDAEGRTIGIMYVGVKKQDYFSIFNTLLLLIVLAAVAAVVISFIVMSRMAKRITQPLVTMVQGMEHSDLTLKLNEVGNSELTALARAFNRYNSQMRETLEQFSRSAEQVASGAAELSQASDEMADTTHDLSRSAEDQRVQMDQATQTVTDLMESIQDVANHASASQNASSHVAEEVALGAKAGGESSKAMAAVRQSTQE